VTTHQAGQHVRFYTTMVPENQILLVNVSKTHNLCKTNYNIFKRMANLHSNFCPNITTYKKKEWQMTSNKNVVSVSSQHIHLE
jgi:hypothetical protein